MAGEVREQAMSGIPEAEREGLLDLLMTMRLNLVAQAAASNRCRRAARRRHDHRPSRALRTRWRAGHLPRHPRAPTRRLPGKETSVQSRQSPSQRALTTTSMSAWTANLFMLLLHCRDGGMSSMTGHHAALDYARRGLTGPIYKVVEVVEIGCEERVTTLSINHLRDTR